MFSVFCVFKLLSTEQIKSDLEKIFTELYKLCLQWRDGSYQTIRSFNFFSALFLQAVDLGLRYAELLSHSCLLHFLEETHGYNVFLKLRQLGHCLP